MHILACNSLPYEFVLLKVSLFDSKTTQVREIAEEIDVLDDMLSALVDILEEKGVLTHEEWEKRIKAKVERSKGKVSYRDLPP